MNAQFESRLRALGLDVADVEERFVLGSGRGGQKVQKTSSCVWLRHRPSGVEVRVQDSRLQAANRLAAWSALCGKLEAAEADRRRTEREQQERDRRRGRQKSRGQKARMVESKRLRARVKASRGRPRDD